MTFSLFMPGNIFPLLKGKNQNHYECIKRQDLANFYIERYKIIMTIMCKHTPCILYNYL